MDEPNLLCHEEARDKKFHHQSGANQTHCLCFCAYLIGFWLPQQRSAGLVNLKWNLLGNEECKKFYSLDVKYMKGPYLTDNVNVEIVRVPEERSEIDLNVPVNTLLTYT